MSTARPRTSAPPSPSTAPVTYTSGVHVAAWMRRRLGARRPRMATAAAPIGVRRTRVRGLAVVAAVCAAAAVCPVAAALTFLASPASARMSWSGPRPIGPSNGQPVTPIACPSMHQCTALDGPGALTFDPASSLPSVDRSLPAEENGLACPLTTLCTAVTDGGRELSFDPERPGALRSRSLGRLYEPSDVACPSSRECVTVGDDGAEVGTEVAYDPLTGGRVGHRFRDPDVFTFTGGLACPTRTECVTLDDLNEIAITFSPLTGRVLAQAGVPIKPYTAPALVGLACPGRRLCVAVDSGGDESVFDPLIFKLRGHGRRINHPGTLVGVACASERLCVAIDPRGFALSGAPGRRGWQAIRLSAIGLTGVACPSATECVVVDGAGEAFVGRIPAD
jgi:hypothetical protein